MHIRLIAAGGTFDKVYDPIGGGLVFDRTTLPDIVNAHGSTTHSRSTKRCRSTV